MTQPNHCVIEATNSRLIIHCVGVSYLEDQREQRRVGDRHRAAQGDEDQGPQARARYRGRRHRQAERHHPDRVR